MSKVYLVRRDDRGGAAHSDVTTGDIVYPAKGHDYGLLRNDFMATGLRHLFMSKDPDGQVGAFTIPEEDLVPFDLGTVTMALESVIQRLGRDEPLGVVEQGLVRHCHEVMHAYLRRTFC